MLVVVRGLSRVYPRVSQMGSFSDTISYVSTFDPRLPPSPTPHRRLHYSTYYLKKALVEAVKRAAAFLWYPDNSNQKHMVKLRVGLSISRNRTNRLVRVDLPELAPRFELPDDGHRGLVVGHQPLSDSFLVVVYAAAAQATLHDSRRHYLRARVRGSILRQISYIRTCRICLDEGGVGGGGV